MQPMQAVEQSASGKGARVAAGAPSQPSQGWPKQGRATCTKNPHLPLTSALVGALCVDAVLVGTAMRHLCATLIYVCRRDGDSPAEPRLWGRSPHSPELTPAFTHQCSGARAAPSPSCSEGSWSPRAPCSARMPGSTLRAGRAGVDTGKGELPVPRAWAAPGEPSPTSTHEVALVPRGLVVAVTALGTEGAAVARAADAEAGAAACAITIASPIATAGLPGPTSTGCTGRDQPAGSQGRRQQPGRPLQPSQHPAHPTVTHTGSLGRRCRAGSKASAYPHTAIGKSRGAAAAWGGGDTALSPLPSPVPPCPCSQTHSWNHHCSTCSSLRSSS